MLRAFDDSVVFSLPIHWYWKWFEFKYSVTTTIQFVKVVMKKVSNNPLHRYVIWSTEIVFQNFQIFHNVLLNFAHFRGGAFQHEIPEKNRNRGKSRANCQKLLKLFLRSRKSNLKEFVWGLCIKQSPKNSFERLHIVKGLLVQNPKIPGALEMVWTCSVRFLLVGYTIWKSKF